MDVHLEGRFLTTLIERKGDRTYLIDTRCSSVWIRVNHLLMLEEGRLVSVWFICVSERSISAGAELEPCQLIKKADNSIRGLPRRIKVWQRPFNVVTSFAIRTN